MGYTFPNVPQLPGVPPLPYVSSAQIGQVVTGIMNSNIGTTLSGAVQSSITSQVTGLYNRVVGNITNTALNSSIGQTITGNLAMATGSQVTTSLDSLYDDEASGASAALTDDSPTVATSTAATQWGIFTQAGAPLIVGDTTLKFEYREEYRIANYPIEGGQLASYNKVKTPYSCRITFAKGGTISDKTEFLNTVAAALSALALLTVITPEATYINANVVDYDYDREAAKGVGLMRVEVMVQEVRVAPTAAFTNTKNPNAVTTQNGGSVQPVAPSNTQAASATASGAQ